MTITRYCHHHSYHNYKYFFIGSPFYPPTKHGSFSDSRPKQPLKGTTISASTSIEFSVDKSEVKIDIKRGEGLKGGNTGTGTGGSTQGGDILGGDTLGENKQSDIASDRVSVGATLIQEGSTCATVTHQSQQEVVDVKTEKDREREIKEVIKPARSRRGSNMNADKEKDRDSMDRAHSSDRHQPNAHVVLLPPAPGMSVWLLICTPHPYSNPPPSSLNTSIR